MRLCYSELRAVMSKLMLPAPTRELRCSNCGSQNRIGTYGVNKLPRCGKCQAGLPELLSKRILRRLYASRYLVLIAAGVSTVAMLKPSVLTDLFPKNLTTTATKSVAISCAGYPQPESGLYASYDPSERVAPLTIKTATGSSYYVKLVDSLTARPVMTFFLRGGETFRHDVPEGSFILKYATGDEWCGESALFGPTTLASQADRVFEFSETRGFTVELIARKGGNLRTKAIDRSRF